MKKGFFIFLLLICCFTFILFTSRPVMAQESLKGLQIALSRISAEDAEAAVDDEAPKIQQTESKPNELNKEAAEVQQVESKDTTSDVPQSKKVRSEKTVSETPKKQQRDSKETRKENIKSQQTESANPIEDNTPKTLDQEVRDLKQEIKKIRDENEARKKLEVPEEAKGQTIDEILSAAGRQYTLLKKGTIGLSYTLGYSYFSSDAVNEATIVERRSNHNLTNTITGEYALFNNLTISTNIPFAYKYNRVGTSSAQEATDLGDISIGFTIQPLKAGGPIPIPIISLGVTLPTGTSPYEVDQNETLATGAGYYAVNGGISLSKVIDPLVAFGNISYTYGFKEDVDQYWSKTQTLTAIEPGGSVGMSMGFGYALSYQASLNMSAQVSYSFGSKYIINDSESFKSGSSLSASFNVGTGWRITPARSIYVTLGIGLTNNDSDFSLNFRLPFEF